MKPLKYSKLSWQEKRTTRDLYKQEQDNKCWYCGESLDGKARADILARSINLRNFPLGFLDYPVHLHHDHVTDLTIGAVHAYCNAVLWQYEKK